MRQLEALNRSTRGWGIGTDRPTGILNTTPSAVTDFASPVNFPIIVGDWRLGYELIRIGEMKITRDPFTVPGFVNFYIRGRFGGILMNNDALKVVAR